MAVASAYQFLPSIIFTISSTQGIDETAYFRVTPTDATLLAILAAEVMLSPLAACAKKNGLDAIHDTVHEMARDEARHGKALEGLLNRYFKA